MDRPKPTQVAAVAPEKVQRRLADLAAAAQVLLATALMQSMALTALVVAVAVELAL